MFFLIDTMMISVLCVVFYCYDDVWGALFFFSIVTIMISALCVVFYFYDEDLRALCCF